LESLLCDVVPSGTGKTQAYLHLQRALTQLRADGIDDPSYQKVKTFILNPKVCLSLSDFVLW
jgi:hypothetical protein